ncbi:hypothetical protein, partial [uncultured Corynebacterium sp.]|uniref:hypothetical protein n=1 Tax=uncultured Corynebacterium sp. TaxID=159447 RepID=UPI0025D7FD14
VRQPPQEITGYRRTPYRRPRHTTHPRDAPGHCHHTPETAERHGPGKGPCLSVCSVEDMHAVHRRTVYSDLPAADAGVPVQPD